MAIYGNDNTHHQTLKWNIGVRMQHPRKLLRQILEYRVLGLLVGGFLRAKSVPRRPRSAVLGPTFSRGPNAAMFSITTAPLVLS